MVNSKIDKTEVYTWSINIAFSLIIQSGTTQIRGNGYDKMILRVPNGQKGTSFCLGLNAVSHTNARNFCYY